jgi:hypothetical protein
MEKELAFEIVAKIIHDRGVELIVGGNPALRLSLFFFTLNQR